MLMAKRKKQRPDPLLSSGRERERDPWVSCEACPNRLCAGPLSTFSAECRREMRKASHTAPPPYRTYKIVDSKGCEVPE